MEKVDTVQKVLGNLPGPGLVRKRENLINIKVLSNKRYMARERERVNGCIALVSVNSLLHIS